MAKEVSEFDLERFHSMYDERLDSYIEKLKEMKEFLNSMMMEGIPSEVLNEKTKSIDDNIDFLSNLKNKTKNV